MEVQVGSEYIRPTETGWTRVHQTSGNRADQSASDQRKQVGSEYIRPTETGWIRVHQSIRNRADQSASDQR